MKRRDFIALLGGTAAAWPLVARAQQASTLPIVAFVGGLSRETGALRVTEIHKGLGEAGFIEGQNVLVEYYWLDGQYERLPTLMADLVRRRVAVIATPDNPVSLAARAATTTIPIVFGVSEDPVRLGLVASLARPGGNATGMNFFFAEVVAKRLGLLHELVPKAARIGVLVNPANTTNTDSTVKDLTQAAPAIGLEIRVLKASTVSEIDMAFAAAVREGADAVFASPDAFYTSRRVQFATLAARYQLPTAYAQREFVDAGGLMSYGTDLAQMYRQAGDYVGRILKGAKPADLPVLQSSKFEFVINLTTARALGLEPPASVLSIADDVIE